MSDGRLFHAAGPATENAFGSDVNKDLGLKAKATDLDPKAKTKAKDSRCQGQFFHQSFYIVFLMFM